MRKSVFPRSLVLLLIVSPLLITSPAPSYAYNPCDGIEPNDIVIIDYTGTIQGGDRDGEIFDGPRDNQQFTISEGGLIQGFYEGMLGLKEGQRKTIVVPPSKGYSGTHDLAGETLVFDVFIEQIISEIGECGSGSGSSGFGATLFNILKWTAGIAVVGFIGVSGYLLAQKQTTAHCDHCKLEGRSRLSDGKCGKCGKYQCRQSFSRGCPNCGSNSFVPNK